MIERFRVFEKDEKKNLAKALMLIHFRDFKKVETGLKNISNFYKNKAGDRIVLNYERDIFEYSVEIPEEKIWEFKDSYESKMARELIVVKNERKDYLLQDFNVSDNSGS